jgi:competence ComEA-like helix-hairpin-helix protein
MLWTPQQRGVLIGLGVVLLALAGMRYWRSPVYLADPPPAEGARASELPGRIDPNTATAPMLAALPNIGPKRAQQIIAYRETFLHDNPDALPFTRPEDLANVKGIGPVTVEHLRPYLVFQEE